MKVIEQEIAALKNTINEMWALVHQQIYNAGEKISGKQQNSGKNKRKRAASHQGG